jgi:hypothetical protein
MRQTQSPGRTSRTSTPIGRFLPIRKEATSGFEPLYEALQASA